MNFVLRSGNESHSTTKQESLFLHPDAAKKSVFWLHVEEKEKILSSRAGEARISLPGPVEGIVTRAVGQNDESNNNPAEDSIFAWGGLQLTSNAKAIEVYYTPPSATKETYLTTLKGIPANNSATTPDLLKALCAVPGGPRAVVSVRLKFLSLQPKGSSTFQLATFKWTARMATVPKPATSTQSQPASQSMPPSAMPPSAPAFMRGPNPSGNVTSSMFSTTMSSTASTPPNDTALTKDDVGAAMAGMSFALRSTEERLTAQLTKATTANQTMQQQLQILSQQVVHQTQLLQYQGSLLQRQHEALVQHGKLLEALQQQQSGHTKESTAVDDSATITTRNDLLPEEKGTRDKIDQQGNNALWLQYASMEL